MKDTSATKRAKKAVRKENKKVMAKSVSDALALAGKQKVVEKSKDPKGKKNFKGAKGQKEGGNKTKSFKPTNKKDFKKKDDTNKGSKSNVRKGKPNTQLVEVLKKHWNSFRDHVQAKDAKEVTDQVNIILKEMQSRILDVALRHDASRIVQCILQFGNLEQRKIILTELCKKAADIAKTPYGHFTILKAITYCTEKDEQEMIIRALNGHFLALGTNSIGARTIESLFAIFPPALVNNSVKSEFYGKKFTVFLNLNGDNNEGAAFNLRYMLDNCPPAKYIPILDHMRDIIMQRFIAKGLLEFSYVHNFIFEYAYELMRLDEAFTSSGKQYSIEAAGSAADRKAIFTRRMAELISSLIEHSHRLLSTKAGSKLVCILVNYANAKERKLCMKGLKGKVAEIMCHSAAHLAILKIIEVTDDVVFVQKTLLEEIATTKIPKAKYSADGKLLTASQFPPLVEIFKNQYGKKVLSRLLLARFPDNIATNCFQYLEPDEYDFFLFSTLAQTSKKPPCLRQTEQVLYLKNSLIGVCTRYLPLFLRDLHASKVVQAVIINFFSSKLLYKLAMLLCGREVVEDEAEEEDLEEENRDHEHFDEGEDEGNDMDDEEQQEGDDLNDEEHDAEALADVNNSDEEQEDEVMEAEDEEEEEVDQTPYIEDLHAHNIAKYVIILENKARNGEIETSQWEEYSGDHSFTVNEKSHFSFYDTFCSFILEDKLFDSWLDINRACFVISAITKCKDLLSDKFTKKLRAAMKGKSASTPGLEDLRKLAV